MLTIAVPPSPAEPGQAAWQALARAYPDYNPRAWLEALLTYAALCRASGADAAQLQALIEEGLLHPTEGGPHDWRFSGHSLSRARRALRLACDLDLGLRGAGIVMELLAEIESLRSRVR